MAAALEPIVLAGDTGQPDVGRDDPGGRRGPFCAGCGPRGSRRPTPGDAPTDRATASVGSTAGPPRSRSSLLAMLGAVGVLAALILVAARPGDGGAPPVPSGTALAEATSEPVPDPTATPDPTAEPTATPEPTPEPSAEPTALPPGEVADLCETFFDLPCSLGAGRYAPSKFRPAFDVELGDGLVHRRPPRGHRVAHPRRGSPHVRR